MPGQDVEDGRTGASLIDDLSQLLLGRIALDRVIDTDRLEAIADLVRQTKDALQVDITFDAAFHRMKGDAPRRGDIRDARSEARRKRVQHPFDRSGCIVLAA